MFGEVLNDDDMLNELDNMVAEAEAANAPEIVAPGTSAISVPKPQPVAQAEEEEEEDEFDRRMKMVAA